LESAKSHGGDAPSFKEDAMPSVRKDSNEELVQSIFLKLLPRWDVKDKPSAKNLAYYAYQMAEGFEEVVKEMQAKQPRLKHVAAKAKAEA
jgi:hypothetical protein